MTQELDPRAVARAQALGLKARTLVEGLRVGDHRSPYRGFSVEFAQHREYVPGDDVRHIDWKSYGRSERYTLKQYEQETNFQAHVLLDASRSMLYGEGEANKLEFAKTLTAVLALLILQQRDSVSLSVFDASWRERLPARSQLGHLQTIAAALERLTPRDKTAIAPRLHELANQLRRRGLVFLISDCFDDVQALLGGVQHLRFHGHEVIVCQVMHAEELELPFEGEVQFEGMEDGRRLRVRPRLVRPAYQRAVQRFLHELQLGCERNRADYVRFPTGRPLGETLAEYLARRLRVRLV